MRVIDQVSQGFKSLRQSLTIENIKALPGKVLNFILQSFVSLWSKVPAAPQPSLWSRVSNAVFGPSKVPVAPPVATSPQPTTLQQLQADKVVLDEQIKKLRAEKSKSELTPEQEDVPLNTRKVSELQELVEQYTPLNVEPEPQTKTVITPLEKMKSAGVGLLSNVLPRAPSFRRNNKPE